jgi:EAL domain-containing protein (putative c-di-GMP-specific phosphodiesterase class I)
MTNKALDFSNFTSQDLLYLYYAVVIASQQKNKMPIISMLDFMNAIDDFNGGEKSVLEFSDWYVEILKNQYSIVDDINDNNKDKKTDNSQSKKKH